MTRVSFFLPVDDASRISEARRIATSLAEREGLQPDAVSNVAIVASELASNLVKHARQGELHIEPLSGRGTRGIEILAVDRGPGISCVTDSLRDGHSTAGTSGTGLGAVRRLSDVFDISSQPGKGTILVSQILDGHAAPCKGAFGVGLAARPLNGETVSGDAWAMRMEEDAMLLMVADGLGHGVLAADASRAAVDAFERSSDRQPVELVQAMHRALHGTRGAAVAVARIEFGQARVRFSGLGNIAGILVGPAKSQAMVSHNGTAGFQAAHIREFVYPWMEDNVIVMHSDGLSTSWSAAASSPEMYRHHPTVIGGMLYRDAARERDDACVIVGKRL